MPEFVRAYTGDDSNILVTVSKEFAKNVGLHTVKDLPVDSAGRPLPPSEGYRKTSATTAAKKDTTSGGAAASNAEEATR